MKMNMLFLMGAALATGLLLLLWGGIIWQFGSLSNCVRYLCGYNYAVYPTVIDVGDGKRGETRVATVTVRNLSFSPIRVVGASTTCNCLVGAGFPLPIGSRQTNDLHFSIHFETSEDEVAQEAMILIDDGQLQRSLPVKIKGHNRSVK